MSKKTLMQSIENYIKTENKTMRYGTGKDAFTIEINEKVPFEAIDRVIELVVDSVVSGNEDNTHGFDYEIMDEIMPFLFISLFTDIPTPIIVDESGNPILDEDGETSVDYVKCLHIYTALDLRYRIFEVSPIIAEYMGIIEKNIWRRLEFIKQKQIQDKEYEAIGEFYSILDDLSGVVDAQSDITPEKVDELIGSFKSLSKEISVLSPDNAEDSIKLASFSKENNV